MTLFTIKYTPQSSRQVVAQEKALAQLKDFILNYHKKEQKAALLLGPLGCGKTSSVHALAKELNYDLLEINSSDVRNEGAMKTFIGAALGQQSLFFRPKIVLIDEIDAISGVEDRGCLPALGRAIEQARFPVIVTANDVSDSKFKQLAKSCQGIEFPPVPHQQLAQLLESICRKERITYDEKALNSLARQADGDVRSALLDLQVCTPNKHLAMEEVLQLSPRKKVDTILNAITIIFKSSTAENARTALENVDLELKEVMVWLDENLPREYLHPVSLAKAYEWLARADIFQGRITKRQYWRFLAYINDLLTAGISSAKGERNSRFVPYQRTMRFLRMWQAKMKWAKKKEIAVKLAQATHTSSKNAYTQVPYLQAIFRASPAAELIKELGLEEEEVEWLRQ